MSTGGMTSTERAISIATSFSLFAVASFLDPFTKDPMHDFLFSIIVSAALAISALCVPLPRIVRALVVGPIMASLVFSEAIYEMVWSSGGLITIKSQGNLATIISFGAVFAPVVEFADPSARCRKWARGRRSLWLVYYGVHLGLVTLLATAALLVSGGLVTLILPVDWLALDDIPRNAVSAGALGAGGLLYLAIASLTGHAGMGLSGLMQASRRSSSFDEDFGAIEASVRNGLPTLSWSQGVASGETLASQGFKIAWKLWLSGIVLGGLLGLLSGNLENGIFGAIVAALLGAFGLPGANTLKFQGGMLQVLPYVKTEADRREEITPVRRREDCEAFIEEHDGMHFFCVTRGDRRDGPLHLAERVLWDSFSNFEEGSHKQWFRSRGLVNETLDWGVIVAQSSEGRIVRVADSVDNHAWLVELLVKLQNTFVAPREAILKEFRAANSVKSDRRTDIASDKDTVLDTPVTPF